MSHVFDDKIDMEVSPQLCYLYSRHVKLVSTAKVLWNAASFMCSDKLCMEFF